MWIVILVNVTGLGSAVTRVHRFQLGKQNNNNNNNKSSPSAPCCPPHTFTVLPSDFTRRQQGESPSLHLAEAGLSSQVCRPSEHQMAGNTTTQPAILITNDDGIDAPGLQALVRVLVSTNRYSVLVCAPDSYVLLLIVTDMMLNLTPLEYSLD